MKRIKKLIVGLAIITTVVWIVIIGLAVSIVLYKIPFNPLMLIPMTIAASGMTIMPIQMKRDYLS